jgi:Ser/Thr protein kinase RdoA (MazF antagonist)
LDGQRAQDLAYLKNLVASLRETIHIFNEKQFPYEWGVIGGDFHGGNHFCTKNGDITLFDFDLCGFGWRTYDLAIFKWALFNVCRRAPRVKNRALLWQAFLEGYRSIKELNQDQISMIAPFVQARQVWLMGSETTYPDKTLNRKYWDEMFEGLKTALDTVGTDS